MIDKCLEPYWKQPMIKQEYIHARKSSLWPFVSHKWCNEASMHTCTSAWPIGFLISCVSKHKFIVVGNVKFESNIKFFFPHIFWVSTIYIYIYTHIYIVNFLLFSSSASSSIVTMKGDNFHNCPPLGRSPSWD